MKIQHIALTIALFAVSATGFAAEKDTINQSVKVGQTISVNSPDDPATAAAGEAINVAWTVDSNNAFKYAFTGTSKDDTGAELKYPQFIKQDVDATGALVANNYDVLDTTFGVALADYESVQKVDTWGKGDGADGKAAELVADTSEANSPYGTMGRVMTGDESGKATINLFSKGIADGADQSGIYNSEVMLTVTAEEQLVGG